MSNAEKVALVESVQEQFGLAPALAVLELSKSTWYYHRRHKVSYERKWGHLRSILEEVARRHPEYGYRRTAEELRQGWGLIINRKVIQRLHRLWDLALLRCVCIPKPSGIRRIILEAKGRVNLVAQLKTIGLFQVAYTDMTELCYAGGRRKAYLMPIIGHVSKKVHGWALGERANLLLARKAWERARRSFRNLGINYQGMIVHHDQDPVFTSYGWTGQLLLTDGVRLSYALQGAKDNTQMESFHSRFKGEWNSLFLDAQSIEELEHIVADRIRYYNTKRRHSTIGYVSPVEFIRQKLPSIRNTGGQQ
jgi:putative transposase